MENGKRAPEFYCITTMGDSKGSASTTYDVSIAKYLCERLVQAGARCVFTVPGDFNLRLLDEILKEDRLKLVRCVNELNAGYAADGYARASGMIAVVFVTFMVGSLSAINAIAGAYAEDLPVLIVTGGPNSHDREYCHILHHTLGDIDFYLSSKCFEHITAGSFCVRYYNEATKKIDDAVKLCVSKKKPVYLELPCNLISEMVSRPEPVRMLPEVPIIAISDEVSLESALQAICEAVDGAEKVLLVAGPKLRPANAIDSFAKLAETLGCCVTVTPDGKSLFDEYDENFLGYYWGAISNRNVKTAMKEADLVIFCGAVFSDYVTVGWTSHIPTEKRIVIAVDHVHVQKRRFSYVFLSTVLSRLCGCLSKKGNFLQGRLQEVSTTGQEKATYPVKSDSLKLDFIQDELQYSVGSGKYSTVVAETGDSWFIAEKLKISGDTSFFIQMQYGSIGWALAACLGVGLVTKELGGNKVLALIGDGSFQVSAQELSTIIEEGLDITIVLMNNASYAIEEQINPGVYNRLVNWMYGDLIKVFGGREPFARSFVCETSQDFKRALAESQEHYGVSLVECRIDKDDCTMELREWGEKVAAANQRA